MCKGFEMKLKSISYQDAPTNERKNSWVLDELVFNKKNLIVGRNATGKSRIVNLINNLARLVRQQMIFDGKWDVCFECEMNTDLSYSVQIVNGKVEYENIILGGEEKLRRAFNSAEIFSEKNSKWEAISPPFDRLILHVRRDQIEFPFLESIVSWAESVRGFGFANTSPTVIEIPDNPFSLTSLNAVPSALEELSSEQVNKVLKQLENIGYRIEKASTSSVAGFQPNVKMVSIKEHGIPSPIRQLEISQGMFRVFALLTIIEFLHSQKKIKLILIDDFCEGLDFDRSKKLAELIFGSLLEKDIQLIVTSNDSFLMNVVPLSALTVCYRDCSHVKGLNYHNSKSKFDKWKSLGLNNFDLFSSNFLLDEHV